MNTKNINNSPFLLVKLLIFLSLTLSYFSQNVLAQDEGNLGTVEKKIPQGSKVVISSSIGDLTVTGWDKELVQAITDDEIPLTIKEEGGKFIISALDGRKHRGLDVSIKVPKNVSLEIIDKRSGDIRIENIVGSTTLSVISGSAHISKVGLLDVSMSSGEIYVEQAGTSNIKLKKGDLNLENISGNVNITNFNGDISVAKVRGDLICTTTSGDISLDAITGRVKLAISSGDAHLSNIESDLSVSSINGEITAECIKGRVDINNATGSIELEDVSDDVQVVTVSGDIRVETAITPRGRYSLKTTSGNISFFLQDNPPGFTADLSSYEGEIETDLEMKLEPQKTPSKQGQENLVGRYGDGQAQIKLSAFSGEVTLLKGYKKSSKCK